MYVEEVPLSPLSSVGRAADCSSDGHLFKSGRGECSGVAQWKRVGLITPKSHDRNMSGEISYFSRFKEVARQDGR